MKAARIVLLAAAPLCCAALMSTPAIAGNALRAWSNLWRTPDQQGQALLDAGQPAQAAERFHDPRRRAYADLEAGRYPEAARLLAPFTDAQSEYNRGNALAKSGQLQAALAAYDAALKQAPADKDIRRNRELVARALQQQQRTPQPWSRSGRQGSQGAGSSGQQPQPSAGSQQGGSGSPQSGGASQQSGAQGGQSAGGSQSASGGSRAGGNQAAHSGRQQSGQTDNPQDAGAQQSANGANEAPGQAQRDAALAAGLARRQQQRGAAGKTAQGPGSARNAASEPAAKRGQNTPDADNLVAGGSGTPKQKPESERQLALDQWLRQIPDSPAGLLQRKFLIEHMMKQQDSGDAQESADPQGNGP